MEKIYDILVKVLKTDERYFSAEGEMLRNAVYEDAMKMDPSLIKLLLSDDTCKNRFFTEVDGVLVFDKVGFGWVINNRQFLPDSYTRFKNKIGLVDSTGDFISASDDVVLAFPYKDCVLEGGQTKEDQKRKEIFYNETLAPDEVDRLLYPKVLVNAKRYTANGVEGKNVSFDENDNLIIKGNNLLSISSLLSRYESKIKLIYIDPPYNTGGDANTFSYNNSFNHSTWLTFMKNRLEVAKRLLKNDGCICIAIDDEEYAHLKVLCDDIFGRTNYVGTIVVQSNPRGRTINSNFATCHEYSLFYAKDINLVTVNDQELTNEQAGDFSKSDDGGQYRLLPFRRSGGTSTPDERPNSEFALYYSNTTDNLVAVGGERTNPYPCEYEPKDILCLENGKVVSIPPATFFQNNPNVISLLPVDILGKRRVWRWSDRKAILESAERKDFVFQRKEGKIIVQLKDRIKSGRKPKTIWYDSKYDASANGTIMLKKMFDGDKLFRYPKSLYTVKDTIHMLTDSDNGDIVLDFFGGSGTTGHAVIELNKADGGNRQFILCEQMDYINTVTTVRVQKTLSESDSFVYCELAKLNQKYADRIQSAETDSEILSIWHDMLSTGFISCKVDPSDIDMEYIVFPELSREDQKRFLMELLDKNQLYVNYCDMEDETFAISEEDKAFTNSFYGEM